MKDSLPCEKLGFMIKPLSLFIFIFLFDTSILFAQSANWEEFFTGNSKLDCDFVTDIKIDKKGQLWIVAEKLYRFNNNKLKEFSEAGVQFQNIAFDKNNGIYLSAKNGIYYFNGTGFIKKSEYQNGYDVKLVINSNDVLIFGGPHTPPIRYENGHSYFLRSGDEIETILDFQLQRFAGISDLCLDQKENLIVADEFDLIRYFRNSGASYNSNYSEIIKGKNKACVMDSSHNLWSFGNISAEEKFKNIFWKYSVYSKDPADTSWTEYPIETQRGQGNLTIGNNYITMYSSHQDTFYWLDHSFWNSRALPLIHKSYITSLAMDSAGNIFIGTAGNGFFIYHPEKTKINGRYDPYKGFLHNNYYSIGAKEYGVGIGIPSKYSGILFTLGARKSKSIKQVNGLSIGYKTPVENINGLSINFECKSYGNLNGIHLSLVNICGKMKGFQFGFYNRHSSSYGVAIGLLRSNSGKLFGISFSMLNSAGGINGIQMGLLNYVGKQINGVQIGLLNYSYQRGDPFRGCDRGTLNGLQAGVVNIVGENNGSQIGLYNRSYKGNGIQIGIVNYKKYKKGFIQIGLINYRENNRKLFRLMPIVNFNIPKKKKIIPLT
jgi:hypothetical protein